MRLLFAEGSAWVNTRYPLPDASSTRNVWIIAELFLDFPKAGG